MDSENSTVQPPADLPIEIDPHTQARIEGFFTAKLKEQSDELRAEAYAREQAWSQHEQSWKQNDASLRAVITSLSDQLRDAKLET